MPVKFTQPAWQRWLIVFALILLPTAILGGIAYEEPWSSGQLRLPEGQYNFQIFTNRVEIHNTSGAMVFSAVSHEPGIQALACGHSESFGFHAFFRRRDSVTSEWRLLLKKQHGPPTVTISTPEAIFSPVLTQGNGNIVVAVSEPFLLGAWDLDSGRVLWEKKFSTPVLTPEIIHIAGREAIRFLLFHQGRYQWFHFFTSELNQISPRIYGPDQEEAPPQNPVPPRESSPDPRTILAFGDSITYGKIDFELAPQLGYVPRLLLLLNDEFPEMSVINVGNPAETTVTAMNRYEYVLAQSNAAYLLFHEGTNDSIDIRIPVSTTLFNIRTIMQYALGLGMQPILTTIIPRKQSHWTGQEPHRSHALAIRSGILALASDLSLPCIDFWTIFENFPAADGGYLSLMSDYVHPSEKGYALMATTFHTHLLALPPSVPTGQAVTISTPFRVLLSWTPNREFDMSGYELNYGFTPDRLDHHVSTLAAQFTFLRPPFQGNLSRSRFFQIFAVDRYGNASSGTDVLEIQFPETFSAATSVDRQKQIPSVKRIPLKSDDNVDTLR